MKNLAMGICFTLSLLGMIPAAHAQTGCEPGKVAERYPTLAGKTVRIATTPFYAPYEYSDPSNPDRLIGSDIEISEQALDCVGLKYEYFKGVFTSLMSTIATGKADAIVANLYFTAERAKAVNFVLYMKAGGALVVPKGNPKNIRSMDDVCGLKTNGVSGNVSATILQEQQAKCRAAGKPELEVILAAEADAAFRGMKNGRIDFFLDNAGGAAVRVAADPSEIEVAFTSALAALVGFGVAKDNEPLLRAYQDGIKALQDSGKMAEILQKYRLDVKLMYPVEVRN